MALAEEMVNSGNRLFRHRSFIPLILYAVALAAIFLDPSDIADPHAWWWQLTCLSVSLLGIAVRAITVGRTPKGTSGRNTAEGQVAQQLNTTGIYSVVRHPLYLGNFLMWLGLIIYTGTPWFIVFAIAFFWFYYERIMLAEEAFIRQKFGTEYEEWASGTAAFIPSLSGWKRSTLRFSFRNVLKREYNGFFATFISFALVNVLKNLKETAGFGIDPFWMWSLGVALIIYITLRTLNKKTALLNVEGR